MSEEIASHFAELGTDCVVLFGKTMEIIEFVKVMFELRPETVFLVPGDRNSDTLSLLFGDGPIPIM